MNNRLRWGRERPQTPTSRSSVSSATRSGAPAVAELGASRQGASRRAPSLVALSALLVGVLGSTSALALDSEKALASAQQQIGIAASQLPTIKSAVDKSRADERSPQARIADDVLLMGSKDYGRAANVLSEIIEKYEKSTDARAATAYADAMSLLGETYYRSKQYLSARRTFKDIVARGNDPRFAPYQGKALQRLVDIAVRIKDYTALDEIFASMNRVPPGSVSSGLAYARGKGLLARKDYGGARAALTQVDPKSEYVHQAQYLLGVLLVKEATPPPQPLKEGEERPEVPPTRYAAAVSQFQRVTQLPGDTEDHRHVIDLSWIAIGRLFYEADQWNQAVQAYNHVDRASPEFGTMLYELAWVYVRLGDVDRAQRALEVLAIAEPNSQNIADGQLLRADLMLRAGQFDKSLKVYETARTTYEPMRTKVDNFLGSTSNPAVYYDKLSQEQLDSLDNNSLLPPLAVQWAREEEDGPAAFAVIDDVQQCRDLIKQSNELIERLNAVLASPNRVRAFPELKAGEERALSILNRIALSRAAIGQGMDDVDDGSLSGEIASWRAKRRSLEKRMALLPVTEGDFADREAQAQRQWNQVSQALQRMQLQVDTLQATINGLRRVLREGPQSGVVRDQNTIARFEEELKQNEHDLALYRAEMDALRKQVNAGKVQVGFGDQRFVDDAETRKLYAEAINNEARLAAQGAAGGKLQGYANRIIPILRQADETDQRVQAAYDELERSVLKRTADMQALVSHEAQNLVTYQVKLEEIDQNARLVVGEVAMKNFGLVRDRLKNIVLRADVGITEVAWEVREEQMTRVRNLQVERAREDRLLKEELNEVLDDSGEEEK